MTNEVFLASRNAKKLAELRRILAEVIPDVVLHESFAELGASFDFEARDERAHDDDLPRERAAS